MHALAHLRGVLDQAVALDDLEDLEPRGAAGRITGVGVAVPHHRALRGVEQCLVNLFVNDDSAKRQVTAADPLGGRDDIRDHSPVLDSPHLARPPGAGDHLVDNHQDVIAVADPADTRKVLRRRRDHAARAHHRLRDEERDVVGPFFKNCLLQLVGAYHPA